MTDVTITLPKKKTLGILDNLGRFIIKVGGWIMSFNLIIVRSQV